MGCGLEFFWGQTVDKWGGGGLLVVTIHKEKGLLRGEGLEGLDFRVNFSRGDHEWEIINNNKNNIRETSRDYLLGFDEFEFRNVQQ